MTRERAQDAARDVIAVSGQCETGQGDHGIAAPVAEPMVACDDSFLIATGNNELVGGNRKRFHESVFNRGTQRNRAPS